jgi:transcriptional regulator GlxA family with amidase domain
MGATLELHFASMDGNKEVVSSAGLGLSKILPFQNFDLCEKDFVFVPGLDYTLLSDADFLRGNIPFINWLKEQYKKEVTICSVCTGAFLLAEAGILNGKKCTTHWKYLAHFREKYPNVELLENRLFVVGDKIYSSAGVASGIDLSLFILEKEFSSKLAADIAKEAVIYFRRSEYEPQLSIYLQFRNHLEDRVHQVQDLLLNNLGNGLKLEELANKVFMSPRNLTRLFKKTTGITIGKYQNKLRLERATSLLSEGVKVEVVAQNCGFAGSDQLRELLKKEAGVLPSDLLPSR